MLQEKLQISREKLEYWYSIGILVFIPILIALNTLLIISGLRTNFDKELQRKADVINQIAGVTLAQQIDDPAQARQTVSSILNNQQEVTDITLLKKLAAGNFEVVAAKKSDLVGQKVQDTQLSIAVDKNRSTAQLIKTTGRSWRVISPLHSSSGDINGALSLDVSLADSDNLTSSLLLRSIVILGASIVLAVLLLFNHFKFVEYALLFRKQKELDQLKNDFLSVATHELKAPMTVIKGNIENATDGLYGELSEKLKPVLQDMYHETDRLNSLVNDLLNVSRLEQGRISYNIEAVDIGKIIEHISIQYSQKAAEKNISINYDSKDAAQISADEGRVTEIMTNLIDNAVKYSRQGQVSISHKISGQMLVTTVRDTGIGMSAQERERLFTRFYRIKNDKTSTIAGTGLGLWIIKQYIVAMKGRIYVDSMEGVGSEFIVELPLQSINK